MHNSPSKTFNFPRLENPNSITDETPNTVLQITQPTYRPVNNNQTYSSLFETNHIPTKTSNPPQKRKHFSNNNLTITFFNNGRSEIFLPNGFALNSTTSNPYHLVTSLLSTITVWIKSLSQASPSFLNGNRYLIYIIFNSIASLSTSFQSCQNGEGK